MMPEREIFPSATRWIIPPWTLVDRMERVHEPPLDHDDLPKGHRRATGVQMTSKMPQTSPPNQNPIPTYLISSHWLY